MNCVTNQSIKYRMTCFLGIGLSILAIGTLQGVPPKFEANLRVNIHHCLITLTGESGQDLLLQRSQDLKTWEDWMRVTAEAGPREVMDNNLSGMKGLFYRAAVVSSIQPRPVSLLKGYPTSLIGEDLVPQNARTWRFTEADIYRLTEFNLSVSNLLRVAVGPADVGIGHCDDGAVWAVIIPRSPGELDHAALPGREAVRHVWLRFHPKEIERIFPPATVFGDGDKSVFAQVNLIANYKVRNSWQAGGRVMIPGPQVFTVDADMTNGLRRFFAVDTQAPKADYYAVFESRPVQEPPAFNTALAESAFDQLWQAYDQDYAMFVLRPEVDWAQSREVYRSRALRSQSTYEFAGICAEMLKSLRDLHIWVTVAGAHLPVFDRPRVYNGNPNAYTALIGTIERAGSALQWGITTNQIGFIAINNWSDSSSPSEFDEILNRMRDTRGLIIDARSNGGGSETLAREVAGRFLDRVFVYAYSQYRNGPRHTDLTPKTPRQVLPRGPWRYDRPVVLLIGQRCMSSNESFIAMMTGAPQVVTMGDHTAGSSGNPKTVSLPLGMVVNLPQWIDYLPDGTAIDEKGITPQVAFPGAPEAFQGTRDDLLSAALERLRSVPLTKESIQDPQGAGNEP